MGLEVDSYCERASKGTTCPSNAKGPPYTYQMKGSWDQWYRLLSRIESGASAENAREYGEATRNLCRHSSQEAGGHRLGAYPTGSLPG